MTPTSRTLLLLALLGLAALATPTSNASPSLDSTWTSAVVSGLSPAEDVDYISIAGTNGSIGFAFHRVTSNDVGFALGDVDNGWTVRALDIQSTDAIIGSPHLVKVSDSTWLISAVVSGVVKVYKSTDAGTTWAVKDTIGSGVTGLAMAGDGAHVAMSFVSSGPTSAVRSSLDAGETWTTSLPGTLASSGALLVRGSSVNLYTSTGTSTSSQDVKKRFSDDDSYWSTQQEVIESTSKSYSSLVAVATTGNFIAQNCFISCSVTPEYDLNYFYASGTSYTSTRINSGVEAGISGNSGNAMASNPAGQVFILAQKSGGTAPLLHYAWSRAAVPVQVSTPLPDADGTAAVTAGNDRVYVALSNGSFGGRLEVWSAAVFDPVPPATTTAVTGLTGFDVDPTGATAIARTDYGNLVRVYPGGTLDVPATSDPTQCSLLGGVATTATHVAYITCNDSGQPATLRIRSPSLGTPTFGGSVCETDNFCQTNINLRDACLLCEPNVEGNQDDDTLLALFEAFPIDYSQIRTSGFNRALMAFAFADAAGNLGVWTYTHLNNVGDSSAITAVGIAGQAPDQICVHRDPNGNSYLYGSSSTSNVRGFRVSFSEAGALDDYKLVPLMTQVFAGTASTAGARGVACGDNRLAILNTDQLTVWERNQAGQSSQPLWTKKGLTSVPLAGVALSYDGQWIEWASNNQWHLAYASNGTEVADGALCTGTFRSMNLQGHGAALWNACQSSVDRWTTFQFTTGNDTTFNPILDLADLDGDGIPNDQDPDVDGDGIANDSDSDDDGDGIPDPLDDTPQGNKAPTEEDAGFFGGLSDDVKVLFAFALILGFVLIAKRRLDMDPEIVKLGVLVIWIACVYFELLSPWSLIAAGGVAVAMFSKQLAKILS